jgi:hypothetical protein
MTLACPHHGNLCAYPPGDPTRCPRCHREWSIITGRDGQRRRDHVNQHRREQGRRQREATARRNATTPARNTRAPTTEPGRPRNTLPNDRNTPTCHVAHPKERTTS